MTIGDMLQHIHMVFPRKTAMIFPDEELSYTFEEIWDETDRIVKSMIDIGVKKGSHVAISDLNSSYWIKTLFALNHLGAVLVPINAQCSLDEMLYILEQADVEFLFINKMNSVRGEEKLISIQGIEGGINKNRFPCLHKIILFNDIGQNVDILDWEGFVSRSSNVTDEMVTGYTICVSTEDIYSIQYTSGTTSKPKGAIITQSSAIKTAIEYGRVLDMDSSDKVLIPIPLHYCFGNILTVISHLIYGTTAVIMSKYSPLKCMTYLSREKCSLISGVSTMFLAMTVHPEFGKMSFPEGLKIAIGGSYTSPQSLRNISEAFGTKNIVNGYGLTECSSLCAIPNIGESFDMRLNTLGKPLNHASVKIIDQNTGVEVPAETCGELLIHGGNVMKGYYKKDDETEKAIDVQGWLHTGDLAKKDDQGNIIIMGRIKDIIIRGGENISPSQIEDILDDINIVRASQVVGISDEIMGEKVVAFIVSSSKLDDFFSQIEQVVRSKLTRSKWPTYYIRIPNFPQNSNGKILKTELRTMAEKCISDGKLDELSYCELM